LERWIVGWAGWLMDGLLDGLMDDGRIDRWMDLQIYGWIEE
jgi:hypothetical protein